MESNGVMHAKTVSGYGFFAVKTEGKGSCPQFGYVVDMVTATFEVDDFDTAQMMVNELDALWRSMSMDVQERNGFIGECFEAIYEAHHYDGSNVIYPFASGKAASVAESAYCLMDAIKNLVVAGEKWEAEQEAKVEVPVGKAVALLCFDPHVACAIWCACKTILDVLGKTDKSVEMCDRILDPSWRDLFWSCHP